MPKLAAGDAAAAAAVQQTDNCVGQSWRAHHTKCWYNNDDWRRVIWVGSIFLSQRGTVVQLNAIVCWLFVGVGAWWWHCVCFLSWSVVVLVAHCQRNPRRGAQWHRGYLEMVAVRKSLWCLSNTHKHPSSLLFSCSKTSFQTLVASFWSLSTPRRRHKRTQVRPTPLVSARMRDQVDNKNS